MIRYDLYVDDVVEWKLFLSYIPGDLADRMVTRFAEVLGVDAMAVPEGEDPDQQIEDEDLGPYGEDDVPETEQETPNLYDVN